MAKIVTAIILLMCFTEVAMSQCSVCTKTAQQLGDGPAYGMNSGIIYLALIPLLVIGFIGFRWWRNERNK